MKKYTQFLLAAAAVTLLCLPIAARAGDDTSVDKNVAAPTPEEKGPPLPMHAVDGGGGILTTPVAYLVDPSERLAGFAGLPSISLTFADPGAKDLEALNVTETLFKRVELGYSGSRLGTGSFDNAVFSAARIHISNDAVYLNTFDLRVLGLEENSFGLPFLPAITAGAQFKWNSGIHTIDDELGGALTSIGMNKTHGVDWTITASKMLKYPFTFNRPLLLSAGVRFSEAEWLGYVGFGDNYKATVEANAAYSITDWLWLAAEYRQNPSQYHSPITVNNYTLVKSSVLDWWDVGAAFVLSKNATVTVGYGNFGDILNSSCRTGWAAQLKYEF